MLKLFELEKRDQVMMCVSVPTETIVEFRRVLFKNGIGLNDVVTHLMRMAEVNDPLLQAVINSTRQSKVKGGYVKKVRMSTEALYDLLESESPLNRSVDNNEDNIHDDEDGMIRERLEEEYKNNENDESISKGDVK